MISFVHLIILDFDIPLCFLTLLANTLFFLCHLAYSVYRNSGHLFPSKGHGQQYGLVWWVWLAWLGWASTGLSLSLFLSSTITLCVWKRSNLSRVHTRTLGWPTVVLFLPCPFSSWHFFFGCSATLWHHITLLNTSCTPLIKWSSDTLFDIQPDLLLRSYCSRSFARKSYFDYFLYLCICTLWRRMERWIGWERKGDYWLAELAVGGKVASLPV